MASIGALRRRDEASVRGAPAWYSAPLVSPSVASLQTATVPDWWPEASLWLGLGLLAMATAGALGAWAVARRLDRLRGALGALGTLEELQRTLARWLGERDDLDLRRIEHLLIDLRDGSRRLEELLLRHEERRVGGPSGEALVALSGAGLGERVVTRLVALGYERIELVTPHQELEAFGSAGGDILVEARREGVLCKGRVRIRGGHIEAVQLQPAFPIFP